MTASAANSGGATQAVTMSADSAPMTATPPNVPARCWLLTSLKRVCNADGSWSVNRPNMESAKATNSNANSTMIQGCWNMAWICCPAAAAATPAKVFITAMPST